MNKLQKRLLIAGALVIVLITWIEPFRQQNPFYFPMIDSMLEILGKSPAYNLSDPDTTKNAIAVVFVFLATAFSLYVARSNDKEQSLSPKSNQIKHPAEESAMNTMQKRLLMAGILVMCLIFWIEPFRQQNPFYFPVIDSMLNVLEKNASSDLSAPDTLKNLVAALFVLLATAFSMYATRSKEHRPA